MGGKRRCVSQQGPIVSFLAKKGFLRSAKGKMEGTDEGERRKGRGLLKTEGGCGALKQLNPSWVWGEKPSCESLKTEGITRKKQKGLELIKSVPHHGWGGGLLLTKKKNIRRTEVLD